MKLLVTGGLGFVGSHLVDSLVKKDHKIKLDQIGPTHIALSVNNLDSVFNNLSKKGIKFISSPQITSDKFAKVAFCIAPEGTFIELVEELRNE